MKQLIEKIIGLLTKRVDFTLHYLCCFFVTAISYNILRSCLSCWAALVIATIIATIVAVGKELIDKYLRGQFIEKGDLISDASGIVTFIITVIVGLL